jgi:hypothetical protein
MLFMVMIEGKDKAKVEAYTEESAEPARKNL